MKLCKCIPAVLLLSLLLFTPSQALADVSQGTWFTHCQMTPQYDSDVINDPVLYSHDRIKFTVHGHATEYFQHYGSTWELREKEYTLNIHVILEIEYIFESGKTKYESVPLRNLDQIQGKGSEYHERTLYINGSDRIDALYPKESLDTDPETDRIDRIYYGYTIISSMEGTYESDTIHTGLFKYP